MTTMVTGTKRLRYPLCLLLIPDHFDRFHLPLKRGSFIPLQDMLAARTSNESTFERCPWGQPVLPQIRFWKTLSVANRDYIYL